MRRTPIVTHPLGSRVPALFDAAAQSKYSEVMHSRSLRSAINATHLGCGLVQTAAGPGNSAALVRAMIDRFGDDLVLEAPVNLRRLSPSEVSGYTNVWRPLAGIHPIIVAAAFGNVMVVRTMIDEIFPGSAMLVACSGLTPILAAMRRQQYAVVELLAPRVQLDHENPSVTFMPTTAPVAFAAWMCDPELVTTLGRTTSADMWNAYYRIDDSSLGHGAPSCATPLIITMMKCANTEGISDSRAAQCVAAMIKCGAIVDKTGRFQRRLLHSNTLTPLECAVDRGLKKCVETLLLAGAWPCTDFGGLDAAEGVPVIRAIKKGHFRIVQLLVAAGGHWGRHSYSLFRWMQNKPIEPAMRLFISAVGKLSTYDGTGPRRCEELLKLCVPTDPILRLAVSNETRCLELLRQDYTSQFLYRWFVWAPRTHATFPTEFRRTIYATTLSYFKLRKATHATSETTWGSVPPEIFVHVLSMLTRL